MNRSLAVITLAAALALGPAAHATDKPPADVRPLSEIVIMLEQKGYSPIGEIEFDDGRWEAKVWKEDKKRKLKIDPRSGEIISDKRN